MDELFPAADVMSDFASYVPVFVAYGIGLALVMYVLGYVIWFIVQIFR